MLWLLAGMAMIAPSAAAAQERRPTPSGETLWRTYPLHTEPERTPTQAEAVDARPATAPASAPDDDPPPVAMAAAVAALLALASMLALRRRSGRRRAPGPAALAGPLLPVALGTAVAPRRGRRSRRLTDLAKTGPPVSEPPPPDPRRGWTAEIQWRVQGGRARFTVVAQAADDDEHAAVAASPPLEWPPADAAAVERLTEAAGRLEAAMLAAGWTPLAPGTAWYAKRFAWTAHRPVAALPQAVPEPGERRFARLPEHLWRCEIRWHPGYVNSHFEAFALEPGHRRGVTVCRSATFRWLLMADPSRGAPEQVEQVRLIAERLEAAGWERAGRGKRWYELRFVWRHDGAPPGHLELASPGAPADGG